MGQQVEKSAPAAAIQKWTEALKAYDTALQLRSDDTDSRYNREYVKKRIEALKKPPEGGNGSGSGGGGSGSGGGGKGQPPQAQRPQGQPPQGNPSRDQPPRDAPPPDQPQQGQRPPGGPQGAPPPAPLGAGGNDSQQADDDRRSPGSMSPAEARALLDSAKSEEHHSLLAPGGPRAPGSSPDKTFKNW